MYGGSSKSGGRTIKNLGTSRLSVISFQPPLEKSLSMHPDAPSKFRSKMLSVFLDPTKDKTSQLRFEMEPIKTSRIAEMETLQRYRIMTDRILQCDSLPEAANESDDSSNTKPLDRQASLITESEDLDSVTRNLEVDRKASVSKPLCFYSKYDILRSQSNVSIVQPIGVED